MKYRIIRNALSETKGRLKQGFDFTKTVFQTTLMARNPSIIYSFWKTILPLKPSLPIEAQLIDKGKFRKAGKMIDYAISEGHITKTEGRRLNRR